MVWTEEMKERRRKLMANLTDEQKKKWFGNISKAKKGKSTKAWSPHKPKPQGYWEKQKETRRKNMEERRNTFYIVDGELLTGSNLVQTKKIKGSTIKKTLAKYTPATQEEIEKWLSEHLGETLMELELMKAMANERMNRMS